MESSEIGPETGTEELNRAVELAEEAVKVARSGQPDPADLLMKLSELLVLRYQKTGSMDDFDRSVDIAEEMVKATPLDHSDRISRLKDLGRWSYERFERFRAMKDIERAVRMNEEVVRSVALEDPERAAYLSNLGLALMGRFEETGCMEDLDGSVKAAEDSVVTSADHPDRGGFLTNLGSHLGTRYDQTGSLEDLNRAVESSYESIRIISDDHPGRAGFLNNLGTWLAARFERTSSLGDLDSAIHIAEESVKATSTDDDPYEAAAHIHNLGNWLGRRFARSGSIDDLDCAIENVEKSISAIPSSFHSTRAVFLANLGIWLGERSKQSGSAEDLDRAIQATSQSRDFTPLNHINRAGILRNLSIWLSRRFGRTSSIGDLDDAIEAISEAVNITPADHLEQANHLIHLGRWLEVRFKRTGLTEDRSFALSVYEEAWSCINARPAARFSAAWYAARMLVSESDWEKSSVLLQGAVELLPLLSPLTLQHEDKQFVLASSRSIAPLAASVALNAGKDAYDALKLLEIGRNVITGLLLDMRSDISDLEITHPDLAARIISLRDELDSPIDTMLPSISTERTHSKESDLKRRHEAHETLDKLIEEIRGRPGFEDFLLPPTAPDLMAAANPDPIIVVNLSVLRSDAFLVEHRQIRVLQLSSLDLGWFEDQAQKPERDPHLYLEWLWDVIAGPCLEALGFRLPVTDDNWPHVWWIVTGIEHSNFPLHAAGRHVMMSHGTPPRYTVLDRVMSSYSSSIKAIIRGRLHRVRKPPGQRLKDALLIAMQRTPNQSTLPYAQDEVGVLERLCPSLRCRPNKPDPNREQVLKHLQTCDIFHFAGHGKSDALDPSLSTLFLKDWEANPLTVRDLRDLKLQKNTPFLAYLSACSTGTNAVAKLGYEGIHLVNACQLAGFRHVIGTFWEVPDEHCSATAEIFYGTLRDEGITDRAVYRGIHRAVRALRDKQVRLRPESNTWKQMSTDSQKEERARDGTLVDEDDDQGEDAANAEEDFSWIFYVHFGV
ncbi:MAG: hypothetical protein LQ346_008328 [Caloplaca aetnensis]|nr:MAG: hypothetical protein LQ346_008328 [Caloplaca aetnensis]